MSCARGAFTPLGIMPISPCKGGVWGVCGGEARVVFVALGAPEQRGYPGATCRKLCGRVELVANPPPPLQGQSSSNPRT